MPESEWAEQRRGVADALGRALTRHAVVLLLGPDRVGKTTLARRVAAGAGAGTYVALAQDPAARQAATRDPATFLRDLGAHAVIDDVHLSPPLLVELELMADRVKTPGVVLAIASSAGMYVASRTHGVRRLPKVSISSLTQGEVRERVGRLIPAAFSGDPTNWPFEALGLTDYVDLALLGGVPELVKLADPMERAKGYADSVEALLAHCSPGEATRLRRMLELVLHRSTARITYEADAAELQIRPNELIDGLETLDALGLLRLSPAWTRFRRGSDSVRAYAADCGYLGVAQLAASADRYRPAPAALVLRTFVAHELHAQNAWARHPVDISFWRSKPSQYDVDFLLEDRTGAVVPVTVSSSLAPGAGEFAGIDAFRRRHPRAYRRGLLLYPGDRIRPMSDHRWAVPLSVLWTVADHEAPLDVASLDAELEAAASALRLLVNRVPATDPEVAEHREGIQSAMKRSLEPRLERIALVLGSLGLGVDAVNPTALPAGEDDPVAPPWFASLQAVLTAGLPNAQLTVVSGLEIRTAGGERAGAARWVAFVSAVMAGHGVVHWQAGHALLPGAEGATAEPALVGVAGPVVCPVGDVEESMVDQLCAALAASLPDALAALTPAA